jgi:hypothetical protein
VETNLLMTSPKNEQFRERGQNKSLSLLRESVTSSKQFGAKRSALIPKRGLTAPQLEQHDIPSKTQVHVHNSNVLVCSKSNDKCLSRFQLPELHSAQTKTSKKAINFGDQRPDARNQLKVVETPPTPSKKTQDFDCTPSGGRAPKCQHP